MDKSNAVRDHITCLNLTEPSPVMTKLYKLCIDNPNMPIPEVLKLGGVSYSVYHNLCKNYSNLRDYKKLQLGQCYKLSDERKDILLSNLARGRLNKQQ